MSDNLHVTPLVIIQADLALKNNEPFIVWKVIPGCGHCSHYPFQWVNKFQMVVSDEQGNRIAWNDAEPGQKFLLRSKDSSIYLEEMQEDLTAKQNTIKLISETAWNNFTVSLFKNGIPVSQRKMGKNDEVVYFEMVNSMFVAARNDLKEGDLVYMDALKTDFTSINIEGISFADIVMMGGGVNIKKNPLIFRLENVVYQ